ncbi:UDP-N-acetylmuramoyl-tripeptide--D-alanyl-D-alanine ligase [bacterium]|nr:UDP-N-acetylmuramoyl-tripeptide--D-alanyl-D-alanine ligase [bacterium]
MLPNLIYLLLAFAMLVWMANFVRRTIGFLHLLQLEGYKSARFWKWAFRDPKQLFDISAAKLGIALFVFGAIAYILRMEIWGIWIFLAAWIATGAYLLLTRKKAKAKKPLVFTPRAVRLLSMSLILMGLGIASIFWLSFSLPTLLAFFVGIHLLTQLAAVNIGLANILLYPLESLINWGYLNAARKKINRCRKLKVIAITGSYGKTSTKHILGRLLSGKYNVLATPESYNTPMGICKVIRGQLKLEHEIFIVEMGAYKRGEIKKLCDLVHPQIGILTSVGPQHLERFKNIDNVVAAKYELIESLPGDGVAIFNNDNEHCRHLANKTKIKTVRYATESQDRKADLLAKDICSNSQGVRFTCKGGTQFQTKLLGRHSVANILAATSAALECGMTLKEVADAVKRLEPVPHRLQLIQGAGGVTVIDDAFNANPAGAMEALEVLKSFDQGAKVLVTPGLIELGDQEFEQNKRFGVKAAQVCDFIFLVGPKRTIPIMEGLKEAGFPGEQVVAVKSLEEATARLKQILKSGDVVLFENDLPDNYSEDV